MFRDRSESELLEEIEQLKEQVAYWRSEAQAQIQTHERRRLQDALGLTPNEAWLLGTLYAADGRIVSQARLVDEMPGRGGHESERESGMDVARVFVSKLRKKLGADVIETLRSDGYRVTRKGLFICQGALALFN